jgi:transcriptional regulator with XRE-family HTH domain
MSKSDERARLGAAVRRQRLRLRLSRAAAACSVGMHHNYFAAIERGEVNPTFETLLRLSRGLGVPLDRLIAEAISPAA